MLKFIKHHAESIIGIEIYPIISFVIFFLFFLSLLIWVFNTNKDEMDEISRIPLDHNSPNPQNKE